MKILVDLHAMDINNGLVSNTGGEGRWGQSWAKLLGERGHEVTCICGGSASWGISQSISNIKLTNQCPEERFDMALFTGEDAHIDRKADLYIYMFWSPDFIVKSPELYNRNDQIIVCPWKHHFHRFKTKKWGDYNNPFAGKSYLMPTPVSQHMLPSNFNSNTIAWTSRWGPITSNDVYFLAFIRLIKKYSFNAKIFMSENFYHHCNENEGENGVRKIKEHLSLVQTKLELLPSLTHNQIMNILKETKVGVPYGGGSSIPELIFSGSLPLPSLSPDLLLEIDNTIYNIPYPLTVDNITSIWERAITDQSFYEKTLKIYQESLVDSIYDNSIKHLQNIINKHIGNYLKV